MSGAAVSHRPGNGPDGEVERLLSAHPLLAMARVTASARPGEPLLRVVPSAAGAEMLRRQGKRHLIDELRALPCPLPADIHVWRVVPDLEAPAGDDDYRFSRPRIGSVTRPSGDSLHAVVWVPYDLRIFEGHFEGIPLLPGMTQLGWVLSIASGHLPRIGRFLGIVAVKFRSLVRPGTDLDLDVEWSASQGELRFEYRHAGATMSLGRLRMTGTA